ncbi:STY4528 family pathogenicity island replication protein [Pseudomaricurvus hydrocarbonicus]|uniref:STY4528 family pathogenicity island replication protein n=1 Tax=Pseudomaricurvus hydrocarbonicus TaxID=1470433 RepID=UPI001AA05689
MGNWHQSIPTLVIQDPVLEPVDKLVWMVIMLCASESRGHAAFPDYDTLARTSNVSSTATIARALAILRLTRWLTQCAKVRQQSGRFSRNLYILHDEPLPLVDALYLDETYMAFVEQAQTHHHARVRRVAEAVSDSLNLDIREGRSLGGLESAVERRLQAAQVLSASTGKHDTGGRYFTFQAAVLQGLKPSVVSGEGGNRLQNLKAAETHYNGSSSCKNHYKKTTTTTTTQNPRARGRDCLVPQRPENSPTPTPTPTPTALIYPPRLSENQKHLADRYLAMLAPEDRQPVLDELQGRLESEHKGMKPVYDELRFLHSLCKSAELGEFVPNLGIKVAEARRDRVRHVPSCEDEPQTLEDAQAQSSAKALGEEQLAKLRASLGMDRKP